MKNLILSGGFHNAPEMSIRVSETLYRMYSCGMIEFPEMLSKYQRSKLERHFCGIKGCKCGSYLRANIEVF